MSQAVSRDGFPAARTTFARELISSLWSELTPLLVAHYREIAVWQDIDLKPNFPFYEKLEELGKFRFYTARLDGALIGYAGFFVQHSHHYMDSLQAQQDIVFVHPDHRGSLIGFHMLRYAEADLKAFGVQAVMHHVKLAHPALGTLLEHMGYYATERIYAKRLDKEGG